MKQILGKQLGHVSKLCDSKAANEPPHTKRTKFDALWGCLDLAEDSQDISTETCELEEYFNSPRGPRNVNPVVWWKEAGTCRFPNLAKVAKKYLCIPCSSVNQ